MPRPEASLEDCPQHLVEFVKKLRAVRNEAGVTLDQLAKITGYSKGHLSKVARGKELQSWDATAKYLAGCGVQGDELDPWHDEYDQVREIDQAIRWGFPRSVGTNKVPINSTVTRPETELLTTVLRRVTTKDQLIGAIDRLARRSGHGSLRRMEKQTGIPRSTLNGWMNGARKPNRLDALVVGLGATPAEQHEFAQALERVWFDVPPHLLQTALEYQGNGCYEQAFVLSDRSVKSGLIRLASDNPPTIAGLSLGHASRTGVGSELDLPALDTGSVIVVGIWVTSVEEVDGERVTLRFALRTVDKTWNYTRHVQLERPDPPAVQPLSSSASSALSSPTIDSVGLRGPDGLRTAQAAGSSLHDLSDRMLGALNLVNMEYDSGYRPRHRKPGPVDE